MDLASRVAQHGSVEASVASRPGRPFLLFLLFLFGLAAAYSAPLTALVRHVAHSDLHSYVLLVPFVSAYLIYIHWRELPKNYESSPLRTIAPALVGCLALAAAWVLPRLGSQLSENDHLGLVVFSFVCFVGAGGFAILGCNWMRAAVFPIGFLIFLVPLPDAAADYLENASKIASADVANLLFVLTGTPVLRNGNVFQLPGIVIEVAKECSGIRSSLVLFITSLLASYLFLRTKWRRCALVAAVIPLGLLRNGFRILTIALLCVHFGPQMIHSIIHRRGGPVFFVASLVPLFLLLWWLRSGESRRSRFAKGMDVEELKPASQRHGR